jgi:integrase/recombinase XerD
LASLQADGLSNATMQQLLTDIRLFHAYLMEEGVRANNPASHSHTGRPLIARHHKLPWIPNEDDWHAVLAAARHEPIRNRVMLAFAYDAGLSAASWGEMSRYLLRRGQLPDRLALI